MEFLFYLLTGAITGLLSGLFGVGGGIIIVGLLTFIFHRLGLHEASIMHMALGTSLATIILTSLSSARAHHAKQNVNWQALQAMTPGVVIGTLGGAYIAGLLSGVWLKAIFSIFVILVAVNLLSSKSQSGVLTTQAENIVKNGQHAIAGLLIGIASSLVGIGGGTLTVPYLNYCKFNIRLAIGTSAALGLPIAIAATTGFVITGLYLNTDPAALPVYSLGYVYLPAFAGIALTSVITAPLGAQLAQRLPITVLKRLFAILLLLVGFRMLWEILG